MGVFNNFRELKDLPGVEKLAKFKQEVMAVRAAEAFPDAQIMELFGKGICYPLSFFWLRTRLVGKAALPRKPDEKSMIFFMYGMGQAQTSAWDLADTLKFAFIDDGCTTGEFFESLMAGIKYQYHNKNVCVGMIVGGHFERRDLPLKLRIKEKNMGGHACAFYYSGNDLLFFDPNIGEYKITDNEESFFKKYLELYYNLKWDFKQADCYALGNKV